MTDGLDAIRDFVYREPCPPDRSGEVAALQSEVDNLRHELMKVRFENTGLYAKIELLKKELAEF
jgi:hypothetical protein